MEQLRCVVERITYHNEMNGYSVIRCRAKGFSELVTAVGMMPEVHVGSVLQLSGRWKIDAKYGRQFSIEQFEETLPATVYGIEKYLGSGLIRGIGPKFARKIVQEFGKDTLEVIENDPDSLLKVPGIGKTRVDQVKKSWTEQKEIKNIMLFLQSHDVSTSHATKIFKTYGNGSIEIVQENPYRLADDIWGIGFRTADIIAEKMGFGHERYARLRSGLLYTLNRLADEGHCYATRDLLLEKGVELLDVEDNILSLTLDEMIRAKDVITQPVMEDLPVLENPPLMEDPALMDNAPFMANLPEKPGPVQIETAIYLPPFFFGEIGCVRRLRDISRNRTGLTVNTEGLADRVARRTGMQYDEIQMQAILTAVQSRILILTGGPGTGKTTTTLGIITAFREAGARILLAAPTGRAAKRLSEATGLEAKTIHRLLEVKPPDGYQKNEEDPLEGDVLIVDECSMIDLLLFYNLLKAVPDTMTLILVGDIDQLPSVGAGNVLRDLIDSACFPVVRLTRIFRQASQSRIITNAHRINEGKMPDISNGKHSDFFFTDMDRLADRINAAQGREEKNLVEPAQAALQTIVDLVRNKLPRYYHIPPSEIQVLTPMQRGIIGATNLNQELQKALNPGTANTSDAASAVNAANAVNTANAAKMANRANAAKTANRTNATITANAANRANAAKTADTANTVNATGKSRADMKTAPGLKRGGYVFRARDKVMQIRNNYDKEVFNGDIGVVQYVNTEDRTMTVSFDDRDVEYDVSELDELVLAYAATIHKAQGSEYPIVVMPVLMNHYIMLQRNLIYTGITRAKKVLVIVGSRRALSYAVRNVTVTTRNTMLRQRLQLELGRIEPGRAQLLRAAAYAASSSVAAASTQGTEK